MNHRREIGLLVGISIGLIAFTLTPYILAGRAHRPDYFFGGFLLNPIDGNSYLAKMYQGWRGMWSFNLPYTAEVGKGAYLFLYYLFLGHIAHLSGLELIQVYHLARLASAIIMLLAINRGLKLLFPERSLYRTAFILIAFGSGLGWLFIMVGLETSDFWVAETFPFLSAFSNPHFPLGIALLIWVLIPTSKEGSYWEAHAKSNKNIQGWSVACATFLMGLISPFGVVIAIAVLGGMVIWEVGNFSMHAVIRDLTPLTIIGRIRTHVLRSEIGRRFIFTSVAGIPVLLYDLGVTKLDPLLSGWNAQNQTPAPLIWDLVISLSPVLFLAVPGAWYVLRQGSYSQRVILIWAILGLLLVYLPIGLQRRFMMGLYIPLAVLAILGLNRLARGSPHLFNLFSTISIILAIPTNLFLLMGAFQGIQTPNPILYLTREEVEAMDWLEQNSPSDAVILAAPDTGLFIPSHTGRRVIYGHPYETVNAVQRKLEVSNFFEGALSDDKSSLLEVVDYIFFGQREKAIGGYLPDGGLTEVYRNSSVIIYDVRH